MKYIVSWAHELLSTNWTEQECETLEEAKELTKLRKAEGFVVLPVEKIKEEEAAPEAVEDTQETEAIDLQTRINLLEAENNQLQQKLEKITEKAVEEIKQLRAENNRLEEVYASSSKYVLQLEQRLEKAKEVYSEQKALIKELNNRIEKAKEVYFAMKAEIKSLKASK